MTLIAARPFISCNDDPVQVAGHLEITVGLTNNECSGSTEMTHKESELEDDIIARPETFDFACSDQVIRREHDDGVIEPRQGVQQRFDKCLANLEHVFLPDSHLGVFGKQRTNRSRKFKAFRGRADKNERFRHIAPRTQDRSDAGKWVCAKFGTLTSCPSQMTGLGVRGVRPRMRWNIRATSAHAAQSSWITRYARISLVTEEPATPSVVRQPSARAATMPGRCRNCPETRRESNNAKRFHGRSAGYTAEGRIRPLVNSNLAGRTDSFDGG